MKKCRKQATCKYCPNPIPKGEYMVMVRFYKSVWGPKIKEMTGTIYQRWAFTWRFHTQCWIDQAIAALEKREIVETRGRKKLEMTDEIRAARLKILMRRAAVTQRIRREIAKPAEEQDIDRVIHLGDSLNKLRKEIEQCGGVPESWE